MMENPSEIEKKVTYVVRPKLPFFDFDPKQQELTLCELSDLREKVEQLLKTIDQTILVTEVGAKGEKHEE